MLYRLTVIRSFVRSCFLGLKRVYSIMSFIQMHVRNPILIHLHIHSVIHSLVIDFIMLVGIIDYFIGIKFFNACYYFNASEYHH